MGSAETLGKVVGVDPDGIGAAETIGAADRAGASFVVDAISFGAFAHPHTRNIDPNTLDHGPIPACIRAFLRDGAECIGIQ